MSLSPPGLCAQPPSVLDCLNCLIWWGMQFILTGVWVCVGVHDLDGRERPTQRNKAGGNEG